MNTVFVGDVLMIDGLVNEMFGVPPDDLINPTKVYL